MTEKSKNDDKPKRIPRQYVGCGCAVLLLMSVACGGYVFRQMFSGGQLFGPGLPDICVGSHGIYTNFKVAGRVIDSQGQPIAQANVRLGSKGTKDCLVGAPYNAQTTEEGAFSFGPTVFAYTDQYFVSVSIPGCEPSVTYDDFPPDETLTITLNCSTPSSP